MKHEHYSVILMHSTNHALRAEKVLENAEIRCKLIPVPRHLSSDCGSCLRVLQTDKDQAHKHLKVAKIEIVRIHDLYT